MKPLLVGEANPYGADPRYALFPFPKSSAGYRLARLILQMPSRRDYLERFDRVNLCPEKWSMKVARENADRILRERPASTIILLGAKVANAFGVPFFPPQAYYPMFARNIVVVMNHPSGLCRAWNEPGAYELARRALRFAGVLPAEGYIPPSQYDQQGQDKP